MLLFQTLTEIDIAKNINKDNSISDIDYLIALKEAQTFIINNGYLTFIDEDDRKITTAYLICHYLYIDGKLKTLESADINGVSYSMNSLDSGESPYMKHLIVKYEQKNTPYQVYKSGYRR